jgi:hypothetical protein
MHSADEARKFATQLRKVYKAVETGSVAKDYFSQPAVTKLGSSGAWTIENKGGLQLEKVVPFIFEMFHGHLYYWRNRCHKIEKRPVSRDWRTERDTAATYRLGQAYGELFGDHQALGGNDSGGRSDDG